MADVDPGPVCFLLFLNRSDLQGTRRVTVKVKGEKHISREQATTQKTQRESGGGGLSLCGPPESRGVWQFIGELMDELAGGEAGSGCGRSLAFPLFPGCCCSSLKIQHLLLPAPVTSPSGAGVKEAQPTPSKIHNDWRSPLRSGGLWSYW
ncbi:unnamed protein product [Pleuronectes platessa]|uniref:Uncharacterized protein n=1 Tax=Pleuronectes platessa TaxID=8262 RepID=A0A9N7Z4A4_PLEPL|nr:unnamed protein product [Pleuronectes platessa]